MNKSVAFYTDIMGMTLFTCTKNKSDNEHTLSFLGYGEDCIDTSLELCHHQDSSQHLMDTGYGHIAIDVEDCQVACKEIAKAGGEIILGPTLVNDMNEIIAFVTDPDGYRVELTQYPADKPTTH